MPDEPKKQKRRKKEKIIKNKDFNKKHVLEWFHLYVLEWFHLYFLGKKIIAADEGEKYSLQD